VTNRALFLRDGHACQYCGRHLSALRKGERLTRDHVLPRCRGGKDEWANVVTACSSCNGRKGSRTPQEAGLPSPGNLRSPTRAQLEALRRSRGA
jgi:5-methylcytosine-specific restriction endonuclease McrA